MTTSLYLEEYIRIDKSSDLIREIKSFLGVFVISPFFLIASIFIYLFVPQKFIALEFREALRKTLFHHLKSGINRLSATILLVITSPLFIILPILIKLDSNGPVLYRQTRIGMNRRKKERRSKVFQSFQERRNGDRRNTDFCGRPFTLYKFRTMINDAEKKTGPVWAINDDPRVTNVGKVIRSLHMDELPQLINIIKGDMRFIGPRPERPHFVKQFVHKIQNYDKRFRLKPGITGWAQIHCGYDRSIEDVKKKLEYEIDYIDNKNSIVYDVKILSKTLSFFMNGKNGVHKI